MNIGNYLQCLNTLGTSTGFLGVYDFSGDKRVLYNELYSTGNQYINNYPNSTNYPLISLNGQPTGSGFYGNNIYQIGNTVSGNFSLLIQLNYDGCNRKTSGIDYVVLSSSPNYSGILSGNGFFLGINESNRLYVESSGVVSILNYELEPQNFVYFSLNNQKNITYGIANILNNTLELNNLTLKNSLPINNILYLGNFLNDIENSHTGFSGNINFSVLSNQSLAISDINNCTNCFFITGIQNIGTITNTYQLPIIEGYSGVLNITTGITGYSYISGGITTISGNTIPIYISSGLTGLITGNTFSNLITGTTSLIVSGNSIYNYIYNTGLYNNFLSYSVTFYLPLMSGDYVEIYTYNSFNPNVNNQFDVLYDYPNTNLYLQLFDNGLLQSSGLDWSLDLTNEITGNFFQGDLIGYDLTSGIPITTAYSGLWSAGKVLLSGGTYFPPNSQYIESGNAIIITGINNQPFNSNIDLYLNGQKIISGLQYSFITSGQLSNIVVLSGNVLPNFDYTALYSPTGGLPTGITNVQSSDLLFYSRENNPNYYLFNINANTNYFNSILGFNPCIYINGIKQTQNFDYTLNYNCSLSSGFLSNPYSFLFFNNSSTYLNVS